MVDGAPYPVFYRYGPDIIDFGHGPVLLYPDHLLAYRKVHFFCQFPYLDLFPAMIDLGGLLQTDDRPGTFADEEILKDPVVPPRSKTQQPFSPICPFTFLTAFLISLLLPGAPISKLYALLKRGDISLCTLIALMLMTL